MESCIKNVKEDIAIEVINRIFNGREGLRVVIAPHPVHGKASSCVPYLDLAEALTVPKDTIYKIILRSKRVRKYCAMDIMSTVTGLKPTLCVFEEGVLHIITKLQPSRCQNPEVGENLDKLQDELIQILRDVLHGYYRRTDQTSLSNAKTLCQLISVANKTNDMDYKGILDEQIEALSGKKINRPMQKALAFQSKSE